MDFTAADRQVWIFWGGAKDCFEAAAKDCRLAVAKMVASSSGAKMSSGFSTYGGVTPGVQGLELEH